MEAEMIDTGPKRGKSQVFQSVLEQSYKISMNFFLIINKSC
jgi:hypothetical protein